MATGKIHAPPGRFLLVRLLIGREIASRLASFWFFLVASLICLIAFLYGSGFQRSFATESVIVTTDPLMLLNIVVVVFIGLVLGLRLATSVSWEREHRTVEVLLVGPVTWPVVIVAKFVVECLVATAFGVVYILYLVAAQPMGAGVIDPGDAAAVAIIGLFILPLMATGLLVSAWARTVRSAVIIYLVLVAGFAAFEALLGLLEAANPDEMSLSALYTRSALEAVSPLISPVSPFGHIAVLLRSLYAQTGVTAPELLQTIGLAALLVGSSIVVARSRGAQ